MTTIDDTRCVLSFLHFIPESSSHLKEEEGPRDEGGEGRVFVLDGPFSHTNGFLFPSSSWEKSFKQDQ